MSWPRALLLCGFFTFCVVLLAWTAWHRNFALTGAAIWAVLASAAMLVDEVWRHRG